MVQSQLLALLTTSDLQSTASVPRYVLQQELDELGIPIPVTDIHEMRDSEG